jgi:hypothetical protein
MKKIKLETEAKNFTQKKRGPKAEKPLTARRYLAGQALSGLIGSSRGAVHNTDIIIQCYEWADRMLEYDD